jgi:hypothetical protein
MLRGLGVEYPRAIDEVPSRADRGREVFDELPALSAVPLPEAGS